MAKKRLTKKQEKFVEEMANPENSNTQAAINAGYSENVAHQQAAENLKKPYIVEAIEKRKKEVALHANVTPVQILGATALRAFATIDDAFDDNGHFDIEKARRTGAIHLIKKISRTTGKYGENVSVEFYSNESAQDKLGNYLKMDNAPNETDERLAQIKQAIQARAEEKNTTYEAELQNYLKHYALPDIKEKLVSELEN